MMAFSPSWTQRDGLVPTSGLHSCSAGVSHISIGCKYILQCPLPAIYMAYVLAGRLILA